MLTTPTIEQLIERAVSLKQGSESHFVLERYSASEWSASLGGYNGDFYPVVTADGSTPIQAVERLVDALRSETQN